MIKAKMTAPDGTPVYIFGLSDGNLAYLRQGRPIDISLAPMGGQGRVLIMWGPTEAAMTAELQEFIGPDTQLAGDAPGGTA